MAIITERRYEPLVDDPDDYRPSSRIALVIDPPNTAGTEVRDLTLLFEQCAPGDRIPLHTHPDSELIVIDDGEAEVTLGQERARVSAGAVVFVPSGVTHGTRNLGTDSLRLHGVFPTSLLTVRYLDRNPAPGTENEPPRTLTLDVRTLS